MSSRFCTFRLPKTSSISGFYRFLHLSRANLAVDKPCGAMGKYFLTVGELQMSNGTVFRFGSRSKMRRAETWDGKQRQAAWKKRYEKSRALDRAKALKRTRQPASLAKGLVAYRKKRKLSRTDFANELGIDRRTLYYYENGSFPVPGNVEKIIIRGDVELSEIFGLPPEAPHISGRFDDARLAINLFVACLEKHRAGSVDEIVAEVVLKTGGWPSSVKQTEQSIKQIAQRITDEVSEREMAEELDKELKDPNYSSPVLRGEAGMELADNTDMQFHVLQQAYATGDEALFDQAVISVGAARRMKSNGFLRIVRSSTGED